MRVKFSHVNCHFSFIFNAPDLFTSFHVSAICNKVIQFQNCWEKTSPCFALATLTLSRISHKQEPITRSLQLPHIPVTAFPQTDLFLVWIYLDFRSPQELQWPIAITSMRGVGNRGVNLPSPYFLSQFLPPPYFFEPISPSSLNCYVSFSPFSLLFPHISPFSQLFLGHFSLLPILFLPPPFNWYFSAGHDPARFLSYISAVIYSFLTLWFRNKRWHH